MKVRGGGNRVSCRKQKRETRQEKQLRTFHNFSEGSSRLSAAVGRFFLQSEDMMLNSPREQDVLSF